MISKFAAGVSLWLFLFFNLPLVAQTGNAFLEAFVHETKAVISVNKTTETVDFIRFPREERLVLPGQTLELKVAAFLQEYGHILGVTTPSEQIEFVKKESDPYGFDHLYYRQEYQGVPVFGGDLRFHFDGTSRLSAVNGVFIPQKETPIFPLLSDQVLESIALNHIDQQQSGSSSIPSEVLSAQMYIFRRGLVERRQGIDHLVYEIEVGNGVDVLEYVYVDAIKGVVVAQFTGTHSVLSRRVFESDFGNLVWEEGNALPGSLTLWQRNEVETAGHTYHFFNHAFDFESYNDAGAVMRTINNNPNLSCPNASWNGSTTNYCDGTASDDVVGHEWAHAYTSYTSGLIYAWQSGALNESYSDIWGEVIDLINNYEDGEEDLSLRTGCNSSDRWLIGEDATAFGSAIRDMWDPTCRNDPGKVSDEEYRCGDGDFGGVHTNSGVNNHAFSLLVDGDNYNGQNIAALGLTKTSHIFWRAQRYYLTSTSDFSVQADALEISCSDLVGIDLEGLSTGSSPAGLSGEIITLADCQEVSDAINAVEFRLDPACGFEPMLAPDPPDICPEGKFKNNILSQDFESGLGDWNVVQLPENPSTWEDHDWEIITNLPDNRPGAGIYGADLITGNCSSDLENGIIRLVSPWITIPMTSSDPVMLAFYHYVSLENKWDGGNIKYKLNDGSWSLLPASAFTFNPYNDALNGGNNDNPMGGQAAFTGADEGSVSGSWGQSQIDLSQLGVAAGDQIRFRWELGTDGCNGWDGWYLDDIVICSCETFLPINLVKFYAEARQEAVLLFWETTLERNNAGFEIQRKEEGLVTFEKVGWVTGHGDSTQPLNYAFEDKTVQGKKTYYYRLMQVDFDGNRTFSNVVSVEMPEGELVTLNLVPNPATGLVTIMVEGIGNNDYSVEVFDTQGNIVFQNDLMGPVVDYLLDLSSINSGLYFVRITGAFGSVVQRLVVE